MRILKKMFSKKITIVLTVIAAVLVIAGFVFTLATSGEKLEKEMTATVEEYIKSFFLDTPAVQYNLLDISYFNYDEEMLEKIQNEYNSEPMVRRYFDYKISISKEAAESDLKKINSVYSSICKSNDNYKKVDVKKAYKFNVKINNKRINKQAYKANFWVVKTEEGFKICTVYEYDRSLDRCVTADMY